MEGQPPKTTVSAPTTAILGEGEGGGEVEDEGEGGTPEAASNGENMLQRSLLGTSSSSSGNHSGSGNNGSCGGQVKFRGFAARKYVLYTVATLAVVAVALGVVLGGSGGSHSDPPPEQMELSVSRHYFVCFKLQKFCIA